ncbi:hypothetical protein UACE39S_02964 [Ureibacillus acetophenoni]
MNNCPIEIPAVAPIIIKGILGGIIGATVEAVAIIAALFSGLYPSFFILGISIDPVAVQSATDDPEIPAIQTFNSTAA